GSRPLFFELFDSFSKVFFHVGRSGAAIKFQCSHLAERPCLVDINELTLVRAHKLSVMMSQHAVTVCIPNCDLMQRAGPKLLGLVGPALCHQRRRLTKLAYQPSSPSYSGKSSASFSVRARSASTSGLGFNAWAMISET